MVYLINAVAWIVDFLLSRKARFLALMPVKMSITLIFILVAGLYLSSILMFVYFLISLFNILFDLINTINSASFGSGSIYGVPYSSFFHAVIGFLNASGLSDAILSSTSLLVTLLSGYFAFAITKVISEKIMNFISSVTDIVRMYES